MQHLMHVDAGDASVKWGQSFHDIAPVTKIKNGAQGIDELENASD